MGKNIILTHKFYKTRRKAKLFEYFFDELEKRFGFEVRYTDVVDVPSDTQIVLAYAIPHFRQHDLLVEGLIDLDPDIYLIVWTADLHCGDYMQGIDTDQCIKNTKRVFERADLILSGFDGRMKSTYSDYLHKYRYFPWGFIPQENYENLKFNEDPIMQCLMVGQVVKEYSPMREEIKQYAERKNIVHYVKGHYRGDQYALMLNRYFGGITDVGNDDIVHAKHFEIPATGSLLFSCRTRLLDEACFVPYKHYVPVTRANWASVVGRVIKKADEYRKVRLAGMNFVRKYHGFNNRMDWLERTIKEIM